MNRFTLAFAVCFVPLTAHAELSPAQQEAQNTFDEETKDALDALKGTCGVQVKLTSDFENFNSETWVRGIQPEALCKLVLQTTESMCKERPVYKKALAKRLTTVSCLFAGVKPKQKKDGTSDFTLRNMSFAKGTLTLRMHGDHVNVEDVTKTTIEKGLNAK